MPSDERVQQALAAVSGPREAFMSAVKVAVDQVGSYLDANTGVEEAKPERAASELGRFAEGRIDPQRFAALTGVREPLDDRSQEVLEEALEVLRALVKKGDENFLVYLDEGDSLVDRVEAALAASGRAFGAAEAVERIRTGGDAQAARKSFTGGNPPGRWSRAERRLAPPLVVSVPGSALDVEGMGRLLEGTIRIVLVVDGPAPPAALVSLVTPGVFVLQTSDAEELARLGDTTGPAIAALLPETCPGFVHDPAGGAALGQRVTVGDLPEAATVRMLGAMTAWRQTEALAQLAALKSAAEAAPPSANGKPSESVEAPAPADRLAAWLLDQANLTNLDG
ncbi:MAG: hypothetical protein ACC667_02905 [Longimicrobiales bacterium]